LALASLSLSMLLASLGTSIANVALPTLAQEFNVSFQAVQWIVLAYPLATTLLIVSVGRLGDVVGRRRLLLAGLGVFAGASTVCAAAPALWLLIAGRAAQGVGAAIMMSLSLAFIGEIVPKEKIGSAMGLLGTTSALGTALGPTLGGGLIASLGWPAIFVANVPLTLLAFALARRSLPGDRRRTPGERAGFDGVGTLLLALTLGAYALAMTTGRGTVGLRNIALFLAAIAGLGLFAFVEAHAASPLLPIALFRDRRLTSAFMTSALISTVMMATLVVGPFYLTRALGLGAALSGTAMSVGPLVVALTGVPAGRLVDRLGAGQMIVFGLIAMAIGTAVLSLLPASAGVAGYVAPIVIVTLGYAVFQTSNNTAVMKDVPQDQRGVISGVLNLSRNLGLISGASVMGAVFAFAAGTTDLATASAAEVATGMRVTFGVAMALVVVALGLAHRYRACATQVATSISAPNPSLERAA
jgi:EmrB/QacA subfamily drug resistance transporter